MTEEQIRKLIREELSNLIFTDRYVFDRALQLMDGRNIQLGKGAGTQIGTETTQKLGFYGQTPTAKGGVVNAPSGGLTVDTEARTAINAIISRLQTVGLIA